MKRFAKLLGIAVCAGLSVGCIDRQFKIYSDNGTGVDAGAFVLVNGKPRGPTPVDDHRIYEGKYEFTLIKDGYQTLHVVENMPPKWYEIFPLDFFFENVWPFRIVDR